jgi:hypothetical protein
LRGAPLEVGFRHRDFLARCGLELLELRVGIDLELLRLEFFGGLFERSRELLVLFFEGLHLGLDFGRDRAWSLSSSFRAGFDLRMRSAARLAIGESMFSIKRSASMGVSPGAPR